jgi:hypothetical protein
MLLMHEDGREGICGIAATESQLTEATLLQTKRAGIGTL